MPLFNTTISSVLKDRGIDEAAMVQRAKDHVDDLKKQLKEHEGLSGKPAPKGDPVMHAGQIESIIKDALPNDLDALAPWMVDALTAAVHENVAEVHGDTGDHEYPIAHAVQP